MAAFCAGLAWLVLGFVEAIRETSAIIGVKVAGLVIFARGVVSLISINILISNGCDCNDGGVEVLSLIISSFMVDMWEDGWNTIMAAFREALKDTSGSSMVSVFVLEEVIQKSSLVSPVSNDYNGDRGITTSKINTFSYMVDFREDTS